MLNTGHIAAHVGKRHLTFSERFATGSTWSAAQEKQSAMTTVVELSTFSSHLESLKKDVGPRGNKKLCGNRVRALCHFLDFMTHEPFKPLRNVVMLHPRVQLQLQMFTCCSCCVISSIQNLTFPQIVSANSAMRQRCRSS